MQTSTIALAASTLGTERGHAAGTWVVDGNTSADEARALLESFEECTYEYPSPLSGEWAGESLPELVAESGLDWDALHTDDAADRNDLDAWCDAYESAWLSAYEGEACRAARYLLD